MRVGKVEELIGAPGGLMRKTLRYGIIGISLAALTSVAGAAQIAFGTFSFSNFGTGDVTFTNSPAGNTLGGNTTQIVLPGQIITSLTPIYLGQQNSFCNAGDCGGIAGPDP